MKLQTYLTENKLTHAAFGALIGVTQATINRYVRGERFPSRDKIMEIHRATNGMVSVSDWYEHESAA